MAHVGQTLLLSGRCISCTAAEYQTSLPSQRPRHRRCPLRRRRRSAAGAAAGSTQRASCGPTPGSAARRRQRGRHRGRRAPSGRCRGGARGDGVRKASWQGRKARGQATRCRAERQNKVAERWAGHHSCLAPSPHSGVHLTRWRCMLSRALPGCEPCSTLSRPRRGGRTCQPGVKAVPPAGVSTRKAGQQAGLRPLGRRRSATATATAHALASHWRDASVAPLHLHVQPAGVLGIHPRQRAHERRHRQDQPRLRLGARVGHQQHRGRGRHLLQHRGLEQAQVCGGWGERQG